MIQVVSHCLTCKAPLEGRTDKRFCDDGCRVSHHRKHSQPALREVGKVLMRNRQLLRRFRLDKRLKDPTPAELFAGLRRAGFDFNFHTHVRGTLEGTLAVMCYDEGYVLELDGIRIVPPFRGVSDGWGGAVAEAGMEWSDLEQVKRRMSRMPR